MPAFRVDTAAIGRAVRDLRPTIFSFSDIIPQLAELDARAGATGDPQCAAAFSGVIRQWGSEMVAAVDVLVALSNNVLAASNEYVATEAAYADQDMYFVDVEDL